MVNKKSLGDIVRQEVQKPQDPVQSETVLQPTPTTSGSTHRKNPTKADLEQKVAELKSTLEEAQDKECTLQENVLELQASVHDQDQLITQLKQELEQAKQTISQLSQMNNELSQTVETLKKEQTTLTTSQPQTPPPLTLARRPQHALSQPGETEDFAKNTWLL